MFLVLFAEQYANKKNTDAIKNEQYEINEQYECKKRTIPVKIGKKWLLKGEQYEKRTILDANNTRDIPVIYNYVYDFYHSTANTIHGARYSLG